MHSPPPQASAPPFPSPSPAPSVSCPAASASPSASASPPHGIAAGLSPRSAPSSSSWRRRRSPELHRRWSHSLERERADNWTIDVAQDWFIHFSQVVEELQIEQQSPRKRKTITIATATTTIAKQLCLQRGEITNIPHNSLPKQPPKRPRLAAQTVPQMSAHIGDILSAQTVP